METAAPGDVNGFMFGDEDSEVGGICVCWSPTREVIRQAIEKQADLIVCHEIPFFFHTNSPWFTNCRTEAKLPNLERYKLLLKYGVVVYRSHSNWDMVSRYGNCDAFGTALGFSHEVARGKLSRIYEVAPIAVQSLGEHVKGCLQLDRVRVAGDLSKIVRKVGTACGGLGQLFNYPEELVALGAEVAIMGEVIDYTIRHALELDLPLIETTHVGSENFGLRNLAHLLQDRFPTLDVTFIDSGMPWTWM